MSTDKSDETDNIIEDNIITGTQSTRYGKKMDIYASGVVIHHPRNILLSNRVNSANDNGYVLDFDEACTSGFMSKRICPAGHRMGRFDNNIADTNRKAGLKVNTHIPRRY